MRIDYRIRLDEAVSLADIFEVVKTLVEESVNYPALKDGACS